VVNLTIRELATAVGVSKSGFDRIWKDRYGAVLMMVQAIDSNVLWVVAKNSRPVVAKAA
jgi:hypothetical protein